MYVNDNINNKLSKLSISIFKNFYNEIIILRKRTKQLQKLLGKLLMTYEIFLI